MIWRSWWALRLTRYVVQAYYINLLNTVLQRGPEWRTRSITLENQLKLLRRLARWKHWLSIKIQGYLNDQGKNISDYCHIKQKGFYCLGQYLKNASWYLHVTKAKHIIASKRSESRHFIEKIGQNRLHHWKLKQNIIQALSTRFRWGSLGVCSLVPGLLWQRSSKLRTELLPTIPKIAVFLLKPKITRNMNYIAAELPNYWNSQTSEVQSAIYETARERNLSNNRSVNPPIKIFGNTVEKQKKH